MYLVVCRKTRAACSHKTHAFIVDFDSGLAYNGEHVAARLLTAALRFIMGFLVLHRNIKVAS